MPVLKFDPPTGPIIDIFNCDDMSDAEVIAAAEVIEAQRLTPKEVSANLQTSQTDATSTPGSSRA